MLSVSGPVAIIVGIFFGRSSIFFRCRFISGCLDISSFTLAANLFLSTARALPAGNLLFSACFIINELHAIISRCSIPTALVVGFELRNELEQTSSAHRLVLCAGVSDSGFSFRISNRLTFSPRCAHWNAASLPASPAPTMMMSSFLVFVFCIIFYILYYDVLLYL